MTTIKFLTDLHKMEIARTFCSHFIRDGLLTPIFFLNTIISRCIVVSNEWIKAITYKLVQLFILLMQKRQVRESSCLCTNIIRLDNIRYGMHADPFHTWCGWCPCVPIADTVFWIVWIESIAYFGWKNEKKQKKRIHFGMWWRKPKTITRRNFCN